MLLNYHIGRLVLSSLCVGAFGAADIWWYSFCRLKLQPAKRTPYIFNVCMYVCVYVYVYICVCVGLLNAYIGSDRILQSKRQEVTGILKNSNISRKIKLRNAIDFTCSTH